MKTKMRLVFIMLVLFCCSNRAVAQVSAFTYQGRLNVNGAPANGLYDFMFRLMNEPTNGAAAPVIPINLAVSVSNGLFTTGMDFGAENFDGTKLWLEVNVRPNSGGNFTMLSPRQLLASTPYAIRASSASNLFGTLPAAQISGTILNTSLPASPNYSGTVTANFFSGNGGGLTNVSALTLGGLAPSNFWSIGGNAGTTPGSHFLGTTDSKALEFKVNGLRALRLEPNVGSAPNVIGGSPINVVDVDVAGATIAGGGSLTDTNRVASNFGAIGGGAGNLIEPNATYATIGGGLRNTIHSSLVRSESTIGGGFGNTIETDAYGSTIAGGVGNTIQINSYHASILGGGNTIEANAGSSTIAGGGGNRIQFNAFNSAIAGGVLNLIQTNANACTIGGGNLNEIQTGAKFSAISGGAFNTIQTGAQFAAVSGGQMNVIGTNALFAVISGGFDNHVSENASYATVAGGHFNSAGGRNSFAAGNRSKALHNGAFVWADSSDFDFVSSATNEFAVRATGGARFVSGIDSNGVPVAGVSLPAGSGSWTSLSDRDAKTNFTPANSRDVLERLAQLPIQSWRYKTEADSIRHLGPVAQDFHAAFGVGPDDKHIATVDADGVALAAIQGLNQKLEEKDAEIQALRKQLAGLEKNNNEREARLARLEKSVEAWNGRPTTAVISRAGD